MSISISHLKDYSISVDQSRCDTSDVAKYIHTDLIQENSKFHKTTLPHYMVFTK